ncbi:2E4.130, partial [Symbiodinium microadriaticum]
HTKGEVDITTDAKSVKTRVERRTLGKSSLDLVIPIREHGDRLHLHWVRSHQTLENHCKEFGTLSKWRWLANAEADKFQTRDLEWEEQLKSKDKANKLVLHFLAERTALLFSHDKDQGPQVQFEGEVASPSKQARPAGLNRKGKLPPKSKEVLSGEADWPNKRSGRAAAPITWSMKEFSGGARGAGSGSSAKAASQAAVAP